MSCCCNTLNNTTTAEIAESRERLTNDLSNCGNTVYFSPAHNRETITPQSGCAGVSDATSIPRTPLCAREYTLCRDQDGCATRYPTDSRNLFWPTFAHPRWLPCRFLYCSDEGNTHRCHNHHCDEHCHHNHRCCNECCHHNHHRCDECCNNNNRCCGC